MLSEAVAPSLESSVKNRVALAVLVARASAGLAGDAAGDAAGGGPGPLAAARVLRSTSTRGGGDPLILGGGRRQPAAQGGEVRLGAASLSPAPSWSRSVAIFLHPGRGLRRTEAVDTDAPFLSMLRLSSLGRERASDA